ncbi:uncharacterized protein B0T15DRAFT_160586 [Chaetomium strumarium]|uniref:RBR-type E3 ubiquitin transferase n=1 Tax=Chaetomium strumarium TaxID=1170767 RepID=A0AAJ0GW71_9PEZI|nr:hypothetical protein B0T15DRAFT_160586 [Chaetomium strumarium]
MADAEQQQGGPSTSRRRKLTGKSKARPANDWSRSGEPQSRASPRSKRHGDIDIDIVESSSDDDAPNARALPRKHSRRRRPQAPSSTTSDTASDTTAPAKTPQRSSLRGTGGPKSMRVPNASVPVLDTAPAPSHHRRPTCIIEEEDDDDTDDLAPSGPSRPVSRQTISRRDTSPRSAPRYRSTPESRRSPRTSVSDSEDDTEATSDSDEEQIIRPRGKHLPPPAPVAPPVPSAPPAAAVHNSVRERSSRRPEMVYEEDGDGTSRYTRSVARHRSLSRPASSGQDHYRRPRDITISSPPSLDETRTRSRSRSKSARPSRRHYDSDVYVSSRPPSSFKRPHAASSYSLGSSKHSTFHVDLSTPPARPSHLDKPAERTTKCALCREGDIPVSKTAKLKCCHRICHSCLRKVFRLSLTDPQHMPPRCCTADNIPVEYVDKLFDSRFKREWNQRYREYASRNRILCPFSRCGELIRPEDMRREGGRWYGKCSRCKTKVCGSCSGKWHRQPECPRDDEAMQFLEQARQELSQRCHRCKALVEVKDGRNHMTCRCGAESCLVCGGKWKSCKCPWFKYDPFEVETMTSARPNPFASRPGSPREFQSDFGPLPAAAARTGPSSYEDDAYVRRLDEQRDDVLARRMHSFDAFGHHHGSHAGLDRAREDYEFEEARDPRDRRRRIEARDYAASFMDDDYHRRAATVVAPSPPQPPVPAVPPPPRSAFEPPTRPGFDRPTSGFDYAPAVHRSRGMRYASPDRYDDYMTENYTPDKRRARSPDWHESHHDREPRSRDRRHTFPSESRPVSPEAWQQLPTRYPSPERAMLPTEERRLPPSPDRRRDTSLDRRLAGRFKTESRQSPTAATGPVGGVGPAGSVGPVGPLGPLTHMRAPPPPSRAATHVGVGMPMAPGPPLGIHGSAPSVPPLRRHHTMDEEVYGPGGVLHGAAGPPPVDWFGPPPHAPHPHHPAGQPASHVPPSMGMMHPAMHDMNMMDINGGSPRAPHVKRRPPQAHREHNKYEAPRPSVLAGLAGIGRGVHRVSEWVNYVEPGPPDADQMPAVVQ